MNYGWCFDFFVTRRMIVFTIIDFRKPWFFFDRRHRLLRDESLKHPVVL